MPKERIKFKTYSERRREAEEKQRLRWEQSLPDPFFQRKTALVLALIFIAYAGYAFIARVAVPMVRKSSLAKGSRTQGIVLLSCFVFLFCMTLWVGFSGMRCAKTNPGRQSWIRVVTKGPGYVKDYVEKTESPPLDTATYQSDDEPEPGQVQPPASDASAVTLMEALQAEKSAAKASPYGQSGQQPYEDPAMPQRRPPRTPVLSPYYLWCTRCERIKPFRAHHCRHSGTCVLKLDHFCPWIGQAVGAQNHKYFLNFTLWCAIWTLFVLLATLLALAPPFRPSYSDKDYIDPQQIVLLVLAAMFTLFTWGLFLSHLRYVLINTTTVEEIQLRRNTRKEATDLAHAYGTLALRKHRQVRAQWDKEWGRPFKEGNPWWLGSARANWEMVCGNNKLAWFLPIAARPSDTGLNYELNPRFTPDGIWKRRKHWPKELQ